METFSLLYLEFFLHSKYRSEKVSICYTKIKNIKKGKDIGSVILLSDNKIITFNYFIISHQYNDNKYL